MRPGKLECYAQAKCSFVVDRLATIASRNDRSEVSLVMPVNKSVFQKEDNSFIKSVFSI